MLTDFAPAPERGFALGSDYGSRTISSHEHRAPTHLPKLRNEFSGAVEFCPVCMLRKALAGGVESGVSSASEEGLKPTSEQAAQRFEHYQLVTGEDGKPVELGRGAMGVTYKAFDVDLHCPVTLKVISERYLGDESARLRFLTAKPKLPFAIARSHLPGSRKTGKIPNLECSYP